MKIGGLFERFTITISRQAASAPGGGGGAWYRPSVIIALQRLCPVGVKPDMALAWLVWPPVLDPHIYVGNNVGNIQSYLQ